MAHEWVDKVPKGVIENLRWRQRMYAKAANDPGLRVALKQACADDILFWVNGFCWTYDPRVTGNGRSPKIPFITWEFQDRAFRDIDDAMGREDLLIEKSRDMGASWIVLTSPVHKWLFRPMQSFLLVSRKEDYVDKAGDPKSLFWKVDFLIKYLPTWMIPAHTRLRLHLHNCENGSTLDGESTTGDVARGDRRTAIVLDEFASVENGMEVLASTGDATDCRIFNSTPKGTGNAFYTQREKGTRRVTMHWSAHPKKAAGLYTSHREGDKFVLNLLDTEYQHKPDYPFITDGKTRSPWYDRECQRRSHQVEIAQELDIDYLGSAYQFFDPETLRALAAEYVAEPLVVGDFDYGLERNDVQNFRVEKRGSLRLWLEPNLGVSPTAEADYKSELPSPWEGHRYVIGCDVASGTGASDTVFSVGDRQLGRKVAEYVDSRITPEEAGRKAVALAKHFNNALLGWEANGPGRAFGIAVRNTGYTHVYCRTADDTITKRVSDSPGWFSTKDTKRVLLGAYREDWTKRRVIIPSEGSYTQAAEYIYQPNQSIEHSKSNNSTDPSASQDNHGDRVIADALMAKFLNTKSVIPKEIIGKPHPTSMQARRESRRRQENEEKVSW